MRTNPRSGAYILLTAAIVLCVWLAGCDEDGAKPADLELTDLGLYPTGPGCYLATFGDVTNRGEKSAYNSVLHVDVYYEGVHVGTGDLEHSEAIVGGETVTFSGAIWGNEDARCSERGFPWETYDYSLTWDDEEPIL